MQTIESFCVLRTNKITNCHGIIIRSNTYVVISVSTLLPGLAVASLQFAASLWAVSFLVVPISAAHEGQRALVHTMHVQPSFPLHDVTAHSDEHDSHGTPRLLVF